MNTFRKSAIVFITFTLIVLCSCSNTDSTITTKSNRSAPAFIPATYEKNITGSDVYDDGWYFEDLEQQMKMYRISNSENLKKNIHMKKYVMQIHVGGILKRLNV